MDDWLEVDEYRNNPHLLRHVHDDVPFSHWRSFSLRQSFFSRIINRSQSWLCSLCVKFAFLCRFLCHIVLVLRKLETRPDITSDDKGTSVLRAYASYLMQTNRAQQVSWNRLERIDFKFVLELSKYRMIFLSQRCEWKYRMWNRDRNFLRVKTWFYTLARIVEKKVKAKLFCFDSRWRGTSPSCLRTIRLTNNPLIQTKCIMSFIERFVNR